MVHLLRLALLLHRHRLLLFRRIRLIVLILHLSLHSQIIIIRIIRIGTVALDTSDTRVLYLYLIHRHYHLHMQPLRQFQYPLGMDWKILWDRVSAGAISTIRPYANRTYMVQITQGDQLQYTPLVHLLRVRHRGWLWEHLMF